MIKKIVVPTAKKTVPEDFTLELSSMTVITGENNTGKTNFIREIIDGHVAFLDIDDEPILTLAPEIVYIGAENIKPSDSEAKTTAKNSGLVENLATLFSNLGIVFNLENKLEITDGLNEFIDKANKNISSFTGGNSHVLKINHNESLDSKAIVQALIKDITGEENGENRKLEDLGQGTQRVIVASMLKAYIDVLISRNINIEKPVLIIIDEPEVYLHPRLKRTLNATLENIAKQPNHQILIITHDPYFVFQGFGKNKKLVSFEKGTDGFTVKNEDSVISGIEDELLFILLYSRLEENKENLKEIEIDGIVDRKYVDEKGKVWKSCSSLESIRHQIHHRGTNEHTFDHCLLEGEDIPVNKNYYTLNELSDAILKMSKKLGEIS